MVPGKYNITIYRGATWSIGINAKDSLGGNMTFGDYDDIRLQVGKSWIKKTDSVSLLTMNFANSRVTLTNADTTVVLTLTAEDTASLNFHEGIYEFELVKNATASTAMIVDRMLYGTIKVANETVI